MRESSLRLAIHEYLGLVKTAFSEAQTAPMSKDNAEWLSAIADVLQGLIKRDDAVDTKWCAGYQD